jgi:hypothetical protein
LFTPEIPKISKVLLLFEVLFIVLEFFSYLEANAHEAKCGKKVH